MDSALIDASLEVGLHINNTKTKSMTIHGQGELELEQQKIEKVDKFKYLGQHH